MILCFQNSIETSIKNVQNAIEEAKTRIEDLQNLPSNSNIEWLITQEKNLITKRETDISNKQSKLAKINEPLKN